MNDPAANTSPLLRPPSALIRSKRLSIADLLLITLGTAIAIWILQPPSIVREAPFVAVSVFMSPLYGSAVAAVIFSVWLSLTRLDLFASEPGHWLLLIIGTMFTGVGLMVRMFPADIVVTERHPFQFFPWLPSSAVLFWRSCRRC